MKPNRLIYRMMYSKSFRYALCERSVMYFAMYYFTGYFKIKMPDFHKIMYRDLNFDGFKALFWIMFRESAKTSIARFKVLHAICYGYKKNIVWVGHDKEKAGKNLRAIANELQANKKIVADFGQLYFEEKEFEGKKSKPKTLSQFVTANDIMVKVQTTQISTRGDLEGDSRPDLYVIDDIENDKTKKSPRMTHTIIQFIDELLGGVSASANLIILANRISTKGVVAFLEKKARDNPDWKIHDVPLEKNGKITWPSKFVATRKEAKKHNDLMLNTAQHVTSIEQLKLNLGSARYAQEYLNRPTAEGGTIVKHEFFTDQSYFNKKSVYKKDGKWYVVDNGQVIPALSFIAVDPALSRKETADDRAIIAGLVYEVKHTDDAGKPFIQKFMRVMEARHGKWSLGEFVAKIKYLKDEYSPRSIGVESNAVQELFRIHFAQYGISTVALHPDADKVRRLNRHTADIEFQRVQFPNDGSCDDLITELIDFTGEPGGKDNLVDAFSYFMDMAKSGGSKIQVVTLG